MDNGVLYLVATPIGNLADITFRAIEVLKNVDLIACEDTRHSKILLDHYGIRKPVVSYHNFSEKTRTPEIVEKIKLYEFEQLPITQVNQGGFVTIKVKPRWLTWLNLDKTNYPETYGVEFQKVI